MTTVIPQPHIPTFKSGRPHIDEVGDGLFAYIQPDGTWSINNPGFIVGPDGVVSVDTCETAQRTKAYIDAVRDFTGQEIRTVVNTHHHPDHTAGNGMLPRATIIGHEQTRAEMIAHAEIELPPGIFEEIDNGNPPFTPPFLTYTDGMTLWLGDRRCEISYVGRPAHTTNDSIVWVADQSVLYAGDLLFKGGTPFLLSGSVTGLIDVLENVIRPLGATTIVPGHGPVCGTEVIDETVDYLQFVSKAARDARAAGVPALDAARELNLGRFGEWTDTERIVGNLHRAMAELDGLPAGGPLDVPKVFQDMVTYNGGPLPVHA